MQAARQSYLTAVQLLVELASLQTAFLTLDEAIKTTNRRVNALDSVVKPMLENTIAYIKVHPLSSSRILPGQTLRCGGKTVLNNTHSLRARHDRPYSTWGLQ